MKSIIVASLIIIGAALSTVMASDGLVSIQSSHSVSQTADNFETVLKEKGMKIFNRINHSDGAKNVGVELRETVLIIFGNPKIGSSLIKCQQSIAIDLPQKALIWEDENNKVWITYNDPKYLTKRHNVEGCNEVFHKITKALVHFSQAAANE